MLSRTAYTFTDRRPLPLYVIVTEPRQAGRDSWRSFGAPINKPPLKEGGSLAGNESSLWRSTSRLARSLAHISGSDELEVRVFPFIYDSACGSSALVSCGKRNPGQKRGRGPIRRAFGNSRGTRSPAMRPCALRKYGAGQKSTEGSIFAAPLRALYSNEHLPGHSFILRRRKKVGIGMRRSQNRHGRHRSSAD